jgi:hypothetical protein
MSWTHYWVSVGTHKWSTVLSRQLSFGFIFFMSFSMKCWRAGKMLDLARNGTKPRVLLGIRDDGAKPLFAPSGWHSFLPDGQVFSAFSINYRTHDSVSVATSKRLRPRRIAVEVRSPTSARYAECWSFLSRLPCWVFLLTFPGWVSSRRYFVLFISR